MGTETIESDQPTTPIKLNMLMGTCTVDRLTDNNPGAGGQGAGPNGDLRYCMTQANVAGDTEALVFLVKTF